MNFIRILFAALALAATLDAHDSRVVAQATPGDADEFLRACNVLRRQQKFDEALANCAKAASLRPEDFRPHALAALVHMAQMKFKSASESAAKAIQLNPSEKELYLVKGMSDSMRGAQNEAVAAARKAIELDPSYAEAHALVGEALRFNKARRAEVAAALREAIKLKPQMLEPYARLGEVLAAMEDEKGAEAVYRQGMAADPKRMAGRFELGRMLVKQGRLAEARELWEGRTSDEDRTFPNFIALLERAENLKRATEAHAKNPNDPEALLAMGLAVMDGDSWSVDGRQERAIVYFKKALEIKPDFAKAQRAIVMAYIQIADTFEKKKPVVDEELAKLRKLDPKLAAEMEAYRKTYKGGLMGTPANLNQ